MNNILKQLFSFGIIGIICFALDFCIYFFCVYININYLISGFLGYSISVCINYILSMKYVFNSNNNYTKIQEILIFVGISTLGLLLTELILKLLIDVIMSTNSISYKLIAKLIATSIVMIYNFIFKKYVYRERK